MAQSPTIPVILIVEDEELLRLVAVDLVENAGFFPLVASNADEALSILEQRSDISLLFTDIHMPGSMDGLRLAHAVRNRWPPIKVIIVSGKVRLSENEMPTSSRFFPKPYRAAHLIRELRDMVGQ
jgi:CheY-like chemotaxis protein